MRYRCARPEGTRARLLDALPLRYMSAITKRSGKMSALSALPPPLSDYYTKENVLFAFAEAVAAGRRPGSATGSGSAGCLLDRHYITLLLWCAAGPLTGCIPKWGRVSGYLWGVTLGCSARYSGQPQIWDAPLSQGVFQIIGKICLTIGGFDQVDGFGLT